MVFFAYSALRLAYDVASCEAGCCCKATPPAVRQTTPCVGQRKPFAARPQPAANVQARARADFDE
eukprot:6211284-Alexandrium_andersonii.AAC.1